MFVCWIKAFDNESTNADKERAYLYGHDELGLVPTCPKCGKLISDKKYKRHLGRCGKTHKHPPRPLDHPENFYMKI
jgi:ribosomal protein S27AE